MIAAMTKTRPSFILASLSLTLLPTLWHAPAHAQDQGSCQVQESNLRDAINSYSRSCSLPRVDCDEIGGEWVCASFNMINGVAVLPVAPQTSSVQTDQLTSGRCEFLAPSLGAARLGYANQCSAPRVDCDPSADGWMCASYQIGAASPRALLQGNTSGDTDTGIVYGGDFGPPQRAWLDSYAANGRCYIASEFDHGIGDVLVDTPAGPRTVREVAAAIGSGPGIGSNPIYNDVQCGNGPANNAGDEDINQCPGRVDLGNAGCSWRGPTWDLSVFASTTAADEPSNTTPSNNEEAIESVVATPSSNPGSSPNPAPSNAKADLPSDSRYQPGDLIALFYDNGGDRDDGHATVAGKMVVSYYGLRDTLHIVNGTYEEQFPGRYNPDSEVVMNVTWGAEGSNDSWWNADARRTTVRNETVSRWRETLEAGRTVWVAEGGPSDFTASVLRQLESSTNLDLKNIQIVQHSHGYNEEHTAPENIRDVERLGTYHRIGNGNLGNNDTPDLNQANDAVARRFLADPEFGDQWRAAFDYLPVFNCDRSQPHCKFDASDVVELMWIVGVQSDEIRDWSDFAARYAN